MGSESLLSALRQFDWRRVMSSGQWLAGFKGGGELGIVPANRLKLVLIHMEKESRRYSRSGNKYLSPINIYWFPVIHSPMEDGTFRLFIGGDFWRELENSSFACLSEKDRASVVNYPAGHAIELYASRPNHPFRPICNYRDDPRKSKAHKSVMEWLVDTVVKGSFQAQPGYMDAGVDEFEMPMAYYPVKGISVRNDALDKAMLELLKLDVWTIEGEQGTMAGYRGKATRTKTGVVIKTDDGQIIVRDTGDTCSYLETILEAAFPGRGIVVELEITIPEGREVAVGTTRALWRPAVPLRDYGSVSELEEEVGPDRLRMLRALTLMVRGSASVEGEFGFSADLAYSRRCPYVDLRKIPPIQKLVSLNGLLKNEEWLFLNPETWPERKAFLSNRVSDFTLPAQGARRKEGVLGREPKMESKPPEASAARSEAAKKLLEEKKEKSEPVDKSSR